MIHGRCPICSRPYQAATIGELPTFPFCSDRCRLIDLGRWSDGSYIIPGSPARNGRYADASAAAPAADEDDHE